jgi:hypothetical protein
VLAVGVFDDEPLKAFLVSCDYLHPIRLLLAGKPDCSGPVVAMPIHLHRSHFLLGQLRAIQVDAVDLNDLGQFIRRQQQILEFHVGSSEGELVEILK